MSHPHPRNVGDGREIHGSYRTGSFRRFPLAPHQMRERYTPTQDLFVLCHLGVPQLERDLWSLTIDGLVARPRRLSFTQLMAYPKCTFTSFHQCMGSPLRPLEPTRRICNVRWSGARLFDIIRDCSPTSEAKYVWSHGADYGEFGGMYHEAYIKDLPIERLGSDVLIAYELNGVPLPVEHGFPARLVVPGFYGTNSVKWLTRITVAKTRATGAFTARWYNDPVPNVYGAGPSERTTPVWSVAPESIIVSPAGSEVFKRDTPQQAWGWAWADLGINRVDVSVDAGETWMTAQVEAREERAWQRFAFSWQPVNPGPVVLCSRAHSHDGAQQPGRHCRNAIYRVEVTVV